MEENSLIPSVYLRFLYTMPLNVRKLLRHTLLRRIISEHSPMQQVDGEPDVKKHNDFWFAARHSVPTFDEG